MTHKETLCVENCVDKMKFLGKNGNLKRILMGGKKGALPVEFT
jgi:hypothetical protein